MNHDDFTKKLGKLMAAVHAEPDSGEQARTLAQAAIERQEKLKRTVSTLQESLDHLRLSVKYLVFDLEATRRENAYLRKLLAAGGDDRNDNSRGGGPADG